MKTFRVDIYTAIHQKLRQMLFEAAIAATPDKIKNVNDKKALFTTLNALFHELKEHARHENTYAHPVLVAKMPHQYKELQSDHEDHETEITNLELFLQNFMNEKFSSIQHDKIALELYRMLNRFIAQELTHMDKEEYLMQNAWELCTPAELFSIMVAFKGIEEPQELPMIMKLVNTNLNEQETALMFECVAKYHGEQKMTSLRF